MGPLSKLFIAGCLLLPFTAQSAPAGPAETVKAFYQEYLNGNGTVPAKIAPYLDRHLISSLNHWGECESGTRGVVCPTECIKFSCNFDGIWIDHYENYFTKTGKSWPTWSTAIRSTVMKKGTAIALVKVTIGKNPDPSVTMKVTMKKAGEQWKIAAVEEIL